MTAHVHSPGNPQIPVIGRHLLDEPRYGSLAVARLLHGDRLRKLSGLRIAVAHEQGILQFLAENVGMLHYLQEKKMRIGSFLMDCAVRKRLSGVEYVRAIETCP